MIRNWSARKCLSPPPCPCCACVETVRLSRAGPLFLQSEIGCCRFRSKDRGRVRGVWPVALRRAEAAITYSLADSYSCQNSASPKSRWTVIMTTLPQGPARCGFGFLSPPAPRACLGRTRVVPAANDPQQFPRTQRLLDTASIGVEGYPRRRDGVGRG